MLIARAGENAESARSAIYAIFERKNIDIDVFDDVLQNTKHRANDASNDVNRPPLPLPAPCKHPLLANILLWDFEH